MTITAVASYEAIWIALGTAVGIALQTAFISTTFHNRYFNGPFLQGTGGAGNRFDFSATQEDVAVS